MKRTSLLIDDDRSVTASLALLLAGEGYGTVEAASPQAALEVLERGSIAAVLQDMNFSRETSGREGLQLLEAIRQRSPEVPVILMTAWGSIELAVEGMKAGAANFLSKPWNGPQLLRMLETTLELVEGRRAQAARTREELDASYDFSGIVGRDPGLLRVLDLAARVAPTSAPVLITGESGTGKELLAEAIHRNSPRREGPFVKVNLGGVSSTLFESEMFGHEKGAFTDAHRKRSGRFAVADGGTIFLDEIGEVELSAQVKLLRVLQDQSFEVLGSSVTRRVDVRVVSATNQDLARMVAGGTFREDLLYRLNLIPLEMPPLRSRSGDIGLLAETFLARSVESYGAPPLTLTPSAIDWLERQSWPGNVRQLRQVIERAVLVRRETEPGALDVVDLRGDAAASDPAGLDPAGFDPTVSSTSGEGGGELALPAPGRATLEQMERAMIARALDHYAGNISRTARALGLSRAALYRRCEKLGLDPRSP
jgi:DNA-binding NtrC family response regulator